MVFPAVADGRVEGFPVNVVGEMEEVTELLEVCVFLENYFDIEVTNRKENKIRIFRFVFLEVVNKNRPPTLIGLVIDYFKNTYPLTTGRADDEGGGYEKSMLRGGEYMLEVLVRNCGVWHYIGEAPFGGVVRAEGYIPTDLSFV